MDESNKKLNINPHKLKEVELLISRINEAIIISNNPNITLVDFTEEKYDESVVLNLTIDEFEKLLSSFNPQVNELGKYNGSALDSFLMENNIIEDSSFVLNTTYSGSGVETWWGPYYPMGIGIFTWRNIGYNYTWAWATDGHPAYGTRYKRFYSAAVQSAYLTGTHIYTSAQLASRHTDIGSSNYYHDTARLTANVKVTITLVVDFLPLSYSFNDTWVRFVRL